MITHVVRVSEGIEASTSLRLRVFMQVNSLRYTAEWTVALASAGSF